MNKKIIKAVIFDMDGVLIDATDWHYEALNRALKVFGHSIERGDHIKIYNGLPTKKKLEIMTAKAGLPLGLHDTIQRLKRSYTDEIVTQKCVPNYSKQLLLSELKKNGYGLACCSNAQKYSVVSMLKKSGIHDLFDLILGNDEGLEPKPAPDIYLAAFHRLGVEPREVVIVEDAPHGVAAAKASGASVIVVRGPEDVNLSLFDNLLHGTKTKTNE